MGNRVGVDSEEGNKRMLNTGVKVEVVWGWDATKTAKITDFAKMVL
jgi:hypothetical protein